MKYLIHLPMKMEPIVSSETSAIRTQTPGNYPKRNNLDVTCYSSEVCHPRCAFKLRVYGEVNSVKKNIKYG